MKHVAVHQTPRVFWDRLLSRHERASYRQPRTCHARPADGFDTTVFAQLYSTKNPLPSTVPSDVTSVMDSLHSTLPRAEEGGACSDGFVSSL